MKAKALVPLALHQRGSSSRARPAGFGMLCWFLAVASQASESSWGVIRCGAPVSESLWLELGTVGVISSDEPAHASFDKAKGQKHDAAGQAGRWAGVSMELGTVIGDPALSGPGSVVGFVATPVVATVGGLSANASRLTPNQLAECELSLSKAMTEMAQQHHLRDLVVSAAREKTRRELVALDSRETQGVNTVLETSVEDLKLERAGSSDTSFRLVIKARARLLHPQGSEALYNEAFEYRSQTALFRDWTGGDGKSFCDCTETGYRQLAGQIVEQVFTKAAGEPVLTGNGYRNSPTCSRDEHVTLVANRAVNSKPVASRLPATPVMDLGSIGVYPKSSAAYLATQLPLTKDEAVDAALSDVTDQFDPLLNHPNVIVFGLSVGAVVPYSIYRQAEAYVTGMREKEVQATEKSIRTASRQLRLDDDLATQLAADLSPRSAQPVVLVKHSRTSYGANAVTQAELASCEIPQNASGAQYVANRPPRRGVDTALEIELVSAALKGDEGTNPKLALCVEARATMYRVSNGQEIFSAPVHYRSEARKFAAWAADDAQLLRDELDRCRTDLSRAVMDQLAERRLVAPESTKDTLATK